MKISIKHYDQKFTISNEREDLTIDEFMDMFKRLAIALYSEELVDKYWE